MFLEVRDVKSAEAGRDSKVARRVAGVGLKI